MAVAYNPKTVTNGLVFAYDMGNTNKSWKGAPATNYVFPSIITGNSQGPGSMVGVSNYGLAPDNTLTATRYYWTTTGNNFIYKGAFTSTAGATYTASLYVKENSPTGTVIQIRAGTADSSVRAVCNFNIATLAVSSGSSVDVTGVSAALTSVGNGWYRISVTGTFTNSISMNFGLIGDMAVNGDVLTWGAQLENNTFATPYIPTTTATVSRTNTQALLDLTSKNTITATSLTYASNNTFSFNGTSNYAPIGTTGFPFGTSAGTLSAWAKTTTISTGNFCWIVSYGNAGTGQARFLGILNSQYYFGGYADDIIANNAPLNTWFNIVGIYDGTNASMYINGTLVAGPTAKTWNTVANSGQIGRQVNNLEYWNGNIDNVSVYSRALSATEVKQNFNAVRGRYGI